MKRYLGCLAFAAALFLCTAAQALDQKDLLFYADFEGVTEAKIARGSPELFWFQQAEQKEETKVKAPGRQKRPSSGVVVRSRAGVREAVKHVIQDERRRSSQPERRPQTLPGVPPGMQGPFGPAGPYRQPGRRQETRREIAGVTFGEGIIGKGVVVGNLPDYYGPLLSYSTRRNLYSYKGTLCFWVSPVDWDSGDNKGHILFEIEGKNEKMILEKNQAGKTTLSLTRKEEKHQLGVWRPVWAVSEWHHIAVTWQVGEVKLFIDGEMKNFANAEDLQLPRKPTNFTIGWGEESSTRFDELMIFSRPLSEEEIQFVRGKRDRKTEKPQIAVPRTASVPRIDGKLRKYEYENAAVISGLTDTTLGHYVHEQTTVFVTYDSENLYFAFDCPGPARSASYRKEGQAFKAEVTERDGPVRTDDSVFVLVKPSNKATAKAFYVNPAGVLLDMDGDDAQWNSSAEAAAFGRARWTAEMRIPLAEVGISSARDGQRIGVNVGRIWKKNADLTAQWFFNPRDPLDTAVVTLTGESALTHLESLGRLSEGDIDVKASLVNGTKKLRKFDTLLKDEKGLFSDSRRIEVRPGETKKFSFKKKIARSISSALMFQVKETGYLNPIYLTSIPYTVSPEALASARYDEASRTLAVSLLNVADKLGARDVYSAEVTVSKKTSAGALARESVPELSRKAVPVSFDLKDAAAGQYVCRTVFSVDGKERLKSETEFEIKEKPEWLAKRAKVPAKVYKPWVPVQSDGADIKVWGRTYSFNESILPTGLVSQGRPILAAPMRWVLTTEEGAISIEEGKVDIIRKSDERVEFRNTFTGKGISAMVEGFVEYDGFCWMKLKIGPKYSPVMAHRLQLEIPLSGREAKLFATRSKEKNSGLVPEEGWAAPAGPIWIGNEERGIEFVFPSTRGWSSEAPDRQIELVRTGSGVKLVFNFIDSPRELNRQRQIEFGFIATPVKPLSPRFQNWRFYLTRVTSQEKGKALPVPEIRRRKKPPIITAQRGQGAEGQDLPPGAPPVRRRPGELSPEEQREIMRKYGGSGPQQYGAGGMIKPGGAPYGARRPSATKRQPGKKPAQQAVKPKKKPPLVLEEMEMPISENVRSLDLWWVDWSAAFNYPLVTPDALTLINEHKRNKGFLFPYVTANLVSPFVEEFEHFEGRWRIIPQQWQGTAVRVPVGKVASLVCPRSSYSDFLLWHLEKAIQKLEPGGIFIDNAVPLPCMNELHGCGYTDEKGEKRPERPILAMREFQKNVLALVKDYDENAIVACNPAGTPYLSNVSFSDLLANGFQIEQLRKKRVEQKKSDNLYDVLSIPQFQAGYVAGVYGLPVVLYDGYTHETEERRARRTDRERMQKSDAYLLGLLLSHDTPLWYGRASEDDPILGYIREIQNFTGWDEALEFYPYWGSEKVVSMDAEKPDRVVSSLYKKENSVLLVLFNDTDEDVLTTVKVDFKKLGLEELSNGRGIDVVELVRRKRRLGARWSRIGKKEIEKLAVDFEDGAVKVSLPKREARVFFFKSQKKKEEEKKAGPAASAS